MKTYLNIVQMDIGAGSPGRRIRQQGTQTMTFQLNRLLDVVVSFAVVGLTITLAGATAVLGA